MVQQKKWESERLSAEDVDKEGLAVMDADFVSIYDGLDKEHKCRLNHLIFSSITSYFKRGETTGKLELRGNGTLKKTWKERKDAYREVRTSEYLGSTGRARTCNPPVNSRMLYH
jgi:hypothetical protein